VSRDDVGLNGWELSDSPDAMGSRRPRIPHCRMGYFYEQKYLQVVDGVGPSFQNHKTGSYGRNTPDRARQTYVT
jgi:hypothetical protein